MEISLAISPLRHFLDFFTLFYGKVSNYYCWNLLLLYYYCYSYVTSLKQIVIVTCLRGGSNLDFTVLLFQKKKIKKTKRPSYFHSTIHCIYCSPFAFQTPFPLVAVLKTQLWGNQLKILPLFSTPTTVSNRSIRSSPWRQTYLVPSTSQEPRATNARAELKGTKITAKFQQAFYLQNFALYLITNITKHYLTLLSYAYHLSEQWTLFWTLTYSLFVPFGVKTLFVVCCINFVTLKVVRLLSSKAVTHPLTAVEVRFILLQNVGIKRVFQGL